MNTVGTLPFDSHRVAVLAIHFWTSQSPRAADANQREYGILDKLTFTGATTFSLVNLRMWVRQAFCRYANQIKFDVMGSEWFCARDLQPHDKASPYDAWIHLPRYGGRIDGNEAYKSC